LRAGIARCDDVGGLGVHIGAHASALAGANEVLVSRTVRDLVVGSDLRFDDRGTHALKGRYRRIGSSSRRSDVHRSCPGRIVRGLPESFLTRRGWPAATLGVGAPPDRALHPHRVTMPGFGRTILAHE
jgi:hypothetical protein